MQTIQVQPAGRPGSGFWKITQGERVLGWASGHRNAVAKAASIERRMKEEACHARAA